MLVYQRVSEMTPELSDSMSSAALFCWGAYGGLPTFTGPYAWDVWITQFLRRVAGFTGKAGWLIDVFRDSYHFMENLGSHDFDVFLAFVYPCCGWDNDMVIESHWYTKSVGDVIGNFIDHELWIMTLSQHGYADQWHVIYNSRHGHEMVIMYNLTLSQLRSRGPFILCWLPNRGFFHSTMAQRLDLAGCFVRDLTLTISHLGQGKPSSPPWPWNLMAKVRLGIPRHIPHLFSELINVRESNSFAWMFLFIGVAYTKYSK